MNDTLAERLVHTGFKSEAKLAYTCCVFERSWLKSSTLDVYTLKIQKSLNVAELFYYYYFSTNLFLTVLCDMGSNMVKKLM